MSFYISSEGIDGSVYKIFFLLDSYICLYLESLFCHFSLFKMLSKLWFELRDEGEFLNMLNKIMLRLQPFSASQARIFSEAYLESLLEDSEVKTDEQRMLESSGMALVTHRNKTAFSTRVTKKRN